MLFEFRRVVRAGYCFLLFETNPANGSVQSDRQKRNAAFLFETNPANGSIQT